MRSVILSAVRTPIGSFLGSLSALPAPKLGSIAIAEAVKRAGVNSDEINEVIMGNVLGAGQGQAPARQAAIYAGLPVSVECMTINKVCGSGLKSLMLADQSIRCGDGELFVVGGMESMSNAPYMLPQARNGYRMGNGELVDSMVFDGLWDPYNNFHMGMAGELCSSECNIPREAQDEFAIASYQKALSAQKNGWFDEEITPVVIEGKKGAVTITKDEEPEKVMFDKITTLRPAFKKDGTITAANASKINDGAAAIVVASEEKASAIGAKPIARIIAQTSYAHKPEWFTTAPAEAIQRVLNKAGMALGDIDLFEVNEAFAVVALITANKLGIPSEKLNVHGGAVALGHPIGASGARLMATLLGALRRTGGKYGIASLCIGGGEANAVIVEML